MEKFCGEVIFLIEEPEPKIKINNKLNKNTNVFDI